MSRFAASIAPSAAPAPNHILRPVHLRQNIAHALFKFPAIFRSGNDARHVQQEQPLAAQLLRHASRRQILRNTLNNCRLADARLADERGIMLVLPRQDLQDRLNFLPSADDQLRFVRTLDHIHSELVEQS